VIFMKKIFIVFVLLSLLLTSTIFAQIYSGYSGYSCSNTNNNFIAIEYCEYAPDLVIAILINFLIAALFFLVGSALKNERWRSMGVGELYEAIAGALIVGLFLYIAYVFLVVVPGSLAPTVVQGSASPITFTLSTINSMESSLEGAFSDAYNNYFSWMALLSTEVKLEAGGVTLPSINIGAFGFPFLITSVLPDYAIAQFIIDAMYILWAEYFMIVYSTLMAIPMFILPGIFLRAFFPTRGFGSMMIAVGMGFLIVMPTLFAFAFSAVCGASGGTANLNSCNLGGVIPSEAQGLFNNQMSNYIAPFWVLILFIPALVLALTYAFITTTANFLGQAPTMGGRIRAFI